jgi:hypothetical protein
MKTLVEKIEGLLNEDLRTGWGKPSNSVTNLIHEIRGYRVESPRIDFHLTASQVAALIAISYDLGNYEGYNYIESEGE